ncbi:MAG: hypothetical protein ACE5JN_04530 [Candidatus Methylomirabilia bacterium]
MIHVDMVPGPELKIMGRQTPASVINDGSGNDLYGEGVTAYAR